MFEFTIKVLEAKIEFYKEINSSDRVKELSAAIKILEKEGEK